MIRRRVEWAGGRQVLIDEPVPVISRFQGRQALRRRSLFAQAQTAAVLAGGETLDAWNEAAEWHRDSPTIIALGAAIGLSPDQIDDLLYEAGAIRA